MSHYRFPITRRRALAVGVSAAIGSNVLPRRWFTAPDHSTASVERGVWPMERHDPARTGYVPSETGPTKDPAVAWQTSLGGDSIGQLVSSGELVYVTSNHAITAVDAATGTQQWRTTHFGTLPWEDIRLGGSPWSDMSVLIEAASILGDNRLFVGADTALYAVTPVNGHAQWEYESTNLSDTLSVGNTVYVLGNVLAAVDATSGIERWKTRAGSGVYPKAYAQESIIGPVLDRENVVGAVDASSGSMKWTRDINLNDVSPPGPCITNGTIYCGSGPLYALNLADGSTQWTQSLGTTEADIKPVSDGPTVYLVINETNRVLALDAQTGDVRWRTDIEEIPDDSAPVLTDETLYVALRYGIVALDPATGDERFRVRLSETEGFTTSPIVTGDTLYVSIDGTLYALSDQ
jgi:outer membrane protein assembly factor BamB